MKKNNIKYSYPYHKILRNTINYLSNNVSSTNSQDKTKNKTNIQFQTRNIRNTQVFTNYTKSCCRSTNNINNNIKNHTVNIFNSNKNIFINNFNNYTDNKKILNLKQKFIHQPKDTSNNLIFDNEANNKSQLDNYFKENKNTKIYKPFYNNNIKLIRNNKIEYLKKSNIYYGINNSILNEIKNKIHQKVKQPQLLYQSNHNNKYNSVISVEKHKNKINVNNQNSNILKDNISIILVNSKSVIKTQNLTSPNNSKIKPKLKHNKEEYLEVSNKDYKKAIKIGHFESSVITYRYHSPIITRGLSESPKHQFLNEKTRCAQIPWKMKKKGIDEKMSEEIVYKRYINKIKKNPFIINNSKINKNIEKINRGTFNNNKQKNTSLNKSINQKIKNKYNHISNNNNNTCYSKDNLYRGVPNLNYKINSPNNQNKKNNIKEYNNQSLNFLDIKTFPLLQAINKKYYFNSNKRIYHRNSNNFNLSNSNNTNNNTNNTNTTNNNYFYNFSMTNSMSMNSIINLKEKQNNNKSEVIILDLSCVISGKNNINECCVNLVNKLKKNGVYFTQKKSNNFIIYKNGKSCEIEIIQLSLENENINIEEKELIKNKRNQSFPLFYYKIITKNNGTINKLFFNIIFSP